MLAKKLLLIASSLMVQQFAVANNITDLGLLIPQVGIQNCKKVMEQMSDHVVFSYNGSVKTKSYFIGRVNNPSIYKIKDVLLSCDGNGTLNAFRLIMNQDANNVTYKQYANMFAQQFTQLSSSNKNGNFSTYTNYNKIITLNAPSDDYEMNITVRLYK